MSIWDRIESKARSIGLEGGLEARVADPLWMLARQWQVLEFQGDDAAQPAAVRVLGQNVKLNGIKGSSGGWQPLPGTAPLEKLVETTPGPDFGAAGLHASVRASRMLIRQLTRAGLKAAVDALRAAFPIRPPERLVQFGNSGAQLASLYARWGLNVDAIANADPTKIEQVLAKFIAPADQPKMVRILTEWRAWYQQRDGEKRRPAWNDERLEYQFSVSAGGDPENSKENVKLKAPEHNGGHLDWYTFDLQSSPAGIGNQRVQTSLPSRVRYRGMPTARWWQFEDGTVNFGDLEAGPADLARLVIAEFATIYSDDWFVVPIKVPVGSLTQITQLQVIDNFGGRDRIHSTAFNDAKQNNRPRSWRMFELTGDEVSQEHPAPWLLVAPTLAGEVNGPVLERVMLTRDEGGNLVWAIEGMVEGLLGRAVNRAEAWFAAQPEEKPPGQPKPAAPGRSYDDQWWQYQLETTTPAWWIPFLPERIELGSPQVRLRRARMQAWERYTQPRVTSQLGPQGLFLDPRRPCWLNEEEVPSMGVRMERRWQFGRWHDGSYHIWLQRRKLAGRGERSSGLRWDLLVPGQQQTADLEDFR